MALRLESTAFGQGQRIPTKHTCDGSDVSPPLRWTGAPEGVRAWALVCDDPDAPARTWVHWVLYDLPADVASLPEGIPLEKTLAELGAARQGKNDFGRIGYGGPCPPRGKPHRYIFRLYALDKKLGLKPGAGEGDVVRAMQGRVLDQAQLIGTYGRA